jgi:16S rRNA processing protein RimM
MTDRESKYRPDKSSGSPPPGEPVFLVVGKLRRPHGVHGEILMDVYTDFPERLKAGTGVYVGETHNLLFLQSQRWHKDAMLVAFNGLNNLEEIGKFRNQLVFVRSDDRPSLPDGEYYHHQIVGLHVKNESDETLGTIVDVLETGANDILVIRNENGSELLVPVIDSVVTNIDLVVGELRVHLLPGLLPEG